MSKKPCADSTTCHAYHFRCHRREWAFIGLFFAFDLALYLVMRDRPPAPQPEVEVVYVPAAEEDRALGTIRKVARQGSWERLESTRLGFAESFNQSNQRPHRGVALYFFPETLGPKSLERDFALNELKPDLEALRRAHEGRSPAEAAQAFSLLRNRVANYELGASLEPDQLSDEAKKFLEVYGSFDGTR